MGRIVARAICAGYALPVGTMGVCPWFYCSSTVLARPQKMARLANGLLVHTSYMVSTYMYLGVKLPNSDITHSSYYIGWLCVGINSSILSYFAIAWFSQWYLRTRCPRWFNKYNYILGAGQSGFALDVFCINWFIDHLSTFTALDGGTQVMVFILSFAVFGAAGDSHLFPQWGLANQAGNYDYCLVIDS